MARGRSLYEVGKVPSYLSRFRPTATSSPCPRFSAALSRSPGPHGFVTMCVFYIIHMNHSVTRLHWALWSFQQTNASRSSQFPSYTRRERLLLPSHSWSCLLSTPRFRVCHVLRTTIVTPRLPRLEGPSGSGCPVGHDTNPEGPSSQGRGDVTMIARETLQTRKRGVDSR